MRRCLLFFLLLCLVLHTPAKAQDAPYAEAVSIPSGLSQEIVDTALRARALLHFLQKQTADTDKQNALFFQIRHTGSAKSAEITPNDLVAISALLYQTSLSTELDTQNNILRVFLHYTKHPNEQERIQLCLKNPELLAASRHCIIQIDEILQSFEQHWPNTQFFTEYSQKKPLYRFSPRQSNWTHEVWQRLADNLQAYMTALKAIDPSPGGWYTSPQFLHDLEQAQKSLPKDPVILTLLAETELRQGLFLQAIEHSSQSIEVDQHNGRARYLRGLAYWQLQQLNLAENDLTLALEEMTPKETLRDDWLLALRARGGLGLLLEHYDTVCTDFEKACFQGDCEGLSYARSRGICIHAPKTGQENTLLADNTKQNNSKSEVPLTQSPKRENTAKQQEKIPDNSQTTHDIPKEKAQHTNTRQQLVEPKDQDQQKQDSTQVILLADNTKHASTHNQQTSLEHDRLNKVNAKTKPSNMQNKDNSRVPNVQDTHTTKDSQNKYTQEQQQLNNHNADNQATLTNKAKQTLAQTLDQEVYNNTQPTRKTAIDQRQSQHEDKAENLSLQVKDKEVASTLHPHTTKPSHKDTPTNTQDKNKLTAQIEQHKPKARLQAPKLSIPTNDVEVALNSHPFITEQLHKNQVINKQEQDDLEHRHTQHDTHDASLSIKPKSTETSETSQLHIEHTTHQDKPATPEDQHKLPFHIEQSTPKDKSQQPKLTVPTADVDVALKSPTVAIEIQHKDLVASKQDKTRIEDHIEHRQTQHDTHKASLSVQPKVKETSKTSQVPVDHTQHIEKQATQEDQHKSSVNIEHSKPKDRLQKYKLTVPTSDVDVALKSPTFAIEIPHKDLVASKQDKNRIEDDIEYIKPKSLTQQAKLSVETHDTEHKQESQEHDTQEQHKDQAVSKPDPDKLEDKLTYTNPNEDVQKLSSSLQLDPTQNQLNTQEHDTQKQYKDQTATKPDPDTLVDQSTQTTPKDDVKKLSSSLQLDPTQNQLNTQEHDTQKQLKDQA
ncbi:MAG: tetratricopeptide repeat protein, partial [Desulfovibrionaceae bacterium]|nr:tetratricopeptide repeat protein [Desulfovibrionaceae bacterium]